MLVVSYDKVVSTLCLCDVVAYIKAKEGQVVFPKEYAGRRLEEVVASFRGVKLAAERGGFTHVFVVRPSAVEKMLKRVAAPESPSDGMYVISMKKLKPPAAPA